jgi:hypothetical protein
MCVCVLGGMSRVFKKSLLSKRGRGVLLHGGGVGGGGVGTGGWCRMLPRLNSWRGCVGGGGGCWGGVGGGGHETPARSVPAVEHWQEGSVWSARWLQLCMRQIKCQAAWLTD